MNGDWVSIDFETANYWPGSICSVGMTAVVAGKITGPVLHIGEPSR
jgi:DNA polymerase-3 subunit epsilon